MNSRKDHAILLVDHGSVRDEANAMLSEVAGLVATLAPDYHVEAAHMEIAAPSIEDGVDACVDAGAREIVVCPYMLAPGRHSTTDIPRLVEEAVRKHNGVKARVTEPLGLDRRLAEVVLSRVKEVEQSKE